MEIICTSSSSGWHVLLQRSSDSGPWRRQPVASWALVADAQGSPFVAAMVVGLDGQAVVFADPGRLVHASQWPACECEAPSVERFDRHWCTTCAGERAT